MEHPKSPGPPSAPRRSTGGKKRITSHHRTEAHARQTALSLGPEANTAPQSLTKKGGAAGLTKSKKNGQTTWIVGRNWPDHLHICEDLLISSGHISSPSPPRVVQRHRSVRVQHGAGLPFGSRLHHLVHWPSVLPQGRFQQHLPQRTVQARLRCQGASRGKRKCS